MKRAFLATLAVASLVTRITSLADTPLTIGTIPGGAGGPCYDDTLVRLYDPSATGSFTLSGVGGSGIVSSRDQVVTATGLGGHSYQRYTYSVDMTAMPATATHCIKVIVHFGSPHNCANDVLQFTGSGVPATAASKAAYGDVTLTFGGGCLNPGQKTLSFFMLTDALPKTNVVTIIDDYSDVNGATNESRINVTAVVPDVPPNWAFLPRPPAFPFFQGHVDVGTNQVNTNGPPLTGGYDMRFSVYDALLGGTALGGGHTQTVSVVNGLFSAPLPFDPDTFFSADRFLDVGIRPAQTSSNFVSLSRLPLTPSPQALYAYSAGVVADISPNQAVTSLNGITGNLILQGGAGIQVVLNGDGRTITISSTGQPSDRNIKTDFAPVAAREILARLAELPIQQWRYTNELATVRHVGPMAQDFKSAFGLGADNKSIQTIDEGGVALSAIQGLNLELRELREKVSQRDAEIQALHDEMRDLDARLKAVQDK